MVKCSEDLSYLVYFVICLFLLWFLLVSKLNCIFVIKINIIFNGKMLFKWYKYEKEIEYQFIVNFFEYWLYVIYVF